MNRTLSGLLGAAMCVLALAPFAPPASAADFDFVDDLPEITTPGVDLVAARVCLSSLKTTIRLTYSASTQTYTEAITGAAKSTCSTERLGLSLWVMDASPLMTPYQKSTSGSAAGHYTLTVSQTVPARLVTQVTYHWAFYPKYSASQCFEKTYTVVQGTAPQAGDTKACDESIILS